VTPRTTYPAYIPPGLLRVAPSMEEDTKNWLHNCAPRIREENEVTCLLFVKCFAGEGVKSREDFVLYGASSENGLWIDLT